MSGQTYERGLRSPAVSVTVFGLYLVGLAVVLVTIPNTLLAIFGIAGTQEPWIRVVGLLAGLIGLLDLGAAGWTWWTLPATGESVPASP
jgi:hypothetical protein